MGRKVGALVATIVGLALLAGDVDGDVVGSSAQTLRRQIRRKKRKEIFIIIDFYCV